MTRLLLLLAALAAVVATAAAAAATTRPAPRSPNSLPSPRADSEEDDPDYRLHLTDITPLEYRIKLTPIFPEDGSHTDITEFEGEVHIIIEVDREEEEVTTTTLSTTTIKDDDDDQEYQEEINLHVAENIYSYEVKVTKTDSENEYYRNDSYTPTTQFLTITTKKLYKGQYDIFITYKARFPTDADDDGMYGFYKSIYTAEDAEGGETSRLLLTTQFQPTHARKAFPCFDEPQYKASFTVELVVPPAYDVIGNTEVTSDEETATDEQQITHTFTTKDVKMSTYLLAFMVYEKESYGSTAKKGTKPVFRTFARKSELGENSLGSAELSQDVGPKILEEYEKYTDFDFVLEKLDQAAIPDFAFGAMENWGLVTYRETALLFNKEEHSETARKRVAETIAHELAHQWFGNLVTTKWWDSAWLNEGFATYFEYYIVGLLEEDWRMMERLVVDEQMYAFVTDAMGTSGPLTDPNVKSPSQVLGHFGTITYSKGGSVLRMFANILGDGFQKGIKAYLIEHSFEPVTPDDLFAALKGSAPEELKDIDLIEFFKSWTTQEGYPLISLEKTDTGVKMTQERFLYEKDDTKTAKYYVPLTFYTIGQTDDEEPEPETVWLIPNEAKEVPVEEGIRIIVANTGYFRVKYTEDTWDHLSDHLLHVISDPLQRATILDDALNLARADELLYNRTMKLVFKLTDEKDFIPWAAAFPGLSYLYGMLSKADQEGVFDKFVLALVSNQYEALGFEDGEDVATTADDDDEESMSEHIRAVHRSNILSWACRSGSQECIGNATDILRAHVDEGEKIDPNIRSVVYCYGVKYGEEDLWIYLWNKFKTTQDAAEKAILISALGCTNRISTLHMYLEQSIAGVYVRSQDASSVFASVYTNPVGVDVALDFLVENSIQVSRSYGSLNALPRVILGIANYLSSDDQIARLKKLEEFNSGNDKVDETVKTAAESAQKAAQANMEWVKNQKAGVLDAMDEAMKPTPGGAWAAQPVALILGLALAAVAALR